MKRNTEETAAALNRNFGLDAMRAVAICLVLLCHFAKAMAVLGSLGVDLFFALSGFLVGGMFLRELHTRDVEQFGTAQLYGFWRRRWYRTLPNYYLFLIIYFALEKALAGAIPWRSWPYTLLLQNLAWNMPGFFFVSWSLAVEEWFYLIFPLLSLVILKITRSRHKAIVSSIIIMISVPTILRFARVPFVLDWVGGLSMVVIYRLDALMFGVCMAWLRFRTPNTFGRLRILAIPATATILMALTLSYLWAFPKTSTVIPAILMTLLPIASALLLPFAYSLKRQFGPANQIITCISLWSYSIYLSHQAILEIAYHLTYPFIHGMAAKMIVKILSLALVLFISKYVYEHFEVPLTSLRDIQNIEQSLPSTDGHLVAVQRANAQ